jgi:hypothetical protein
VTNSDISPSRWYYGLSVLILVVGLSAFVWLLFSSISGMAGGLIQVVAPGSADLDLGEVGEYTIFYENQSYANGSFYSTGKDVSGLQIEIVEKSTGIKLATNLPSGSFTYSIGGRFGQAILTFQVSRPGIYQLLASYPQDYQGPQVILAVGHGFMGRIISIVITSLAAFFGSIIIAAALTIIIYRKRQKALDQQREEERLVRGGNPKAEL